jgi:tRNA (pseudouridine54-N1)-methyltransferase
MRTFIILALHAPTTPFFDLSHLPDAGKLDVVCRVISNSLWVSSGPRKDTIVHAVLNGAPSAPKTITFTGSELHEFCFDEKGLALEIQRALRKGWKLGMNESTKVRPGIEVSKIPFERLVKGKKIFYLHKKGEDIRKAEFPEDATFVLGDIHGLYIKTEKLLKQLGGKRITLGPIMEFASHCPIIVHNELDRRIAGW